MKIWKSNEEYFKPYKRKLIFSYLCSMISFIFQQIPHRLVESLSSVFRLLINPTCLFYLLVLLLLLICITVNVQSFKCRRKKISYRSVTEKSFEFSGSDFGNYTWILFGTWPDNHSCLISEIIFITTLISSTLLTDLFINSLCSAAPR